MERGRQNKEGPQDSRTSIVVNFWIFSFVLNTLHPGSTNIGKKKGREEGREENKPLKANSLPKGPEKE